MEIFFYLGVMGLSLLGLRVWHLFYLNQKLPKEVSWRSSTPSLERTVLLQLPCFNEGVVILDLLEACSRIDYPRDLVRLQILDDSTESDSRALVDLGVEKLRTAGHRVERIRREDRIGFKAGACQAGLQGAKEEFVAILDSDFRPTQDFLNRALPGFFDDTVAFVQLPWGFLNPNASMLTRGQALSLEAHFSVEQRTRALSGFFFHFNGTAGVWRRRVIEELGGWNGDLLTEDMDLSLRAYTRGYRGVYFDGPEQPSLLPESLEDLKVQQHRWTAGTLQNARRHLTPSEGLSADLGFKLLGPLAWNFSFFLFLGYGPFIASLSPTELDLSWMHGVLLVLMGFNFLALWWLYRRARPTQALVRFIGDFTLLIIMSVALTPSSAWAVGVGLFGGTQEFVRTPKVQVKRKRQALSRRWIFCCEILALASVLWGLWIQAHRGWYWGMPMGVILALGLFAAAFYDQLMFRRLFDRRNRAAKMDTVSLDPQV